MQGPDECILTSELPCILSILEPNQSFILHMIRSQQDPLIKWYIVQLEKLLSFIHQTEGFSPLNLGNSNFTVLVVKTKSWCPYTLRDKALVGELGLDCHIFPTLEKL